MKQSVMLILCFSFLFARAQVTLEQCQERAKSNYPLIKQYDLITKSTEYTLSNANKAYLPQVSITALGAYVISGLPQISVPGQAENEPSKFQFIGIGQINQTIWDGGATHAQKDIANANAAVENSSIDVSLYAIRERVNQLFFGILLIDEQVKQMDILKDNLNLNLNKVKLSKENGYAYQTDVDEVKAELLNLEQKMIEFNYARAGYIQMLSFITGQALDENEKLVTPVIPESVESLTNNRPELSLYANQVKLIEAQSSVNKVYNMPKIGLIGAGALIEPGLDFGSATINSIAIAGLSVRWNTAGLYTNSANKNLDKIRIDRVLNQQETFSFTNKMELTQTAADIQKQKAVIEKDNEIVMLKTEIKNAYQLRYDNGMSSMSDLIEALNKENEAKSNRELHTMQLLMSLYNYKTTSGNQ